MNVTKLYKEDDCKPWEYGDEGRFAGGLYGAVVVVYLICFLAISKSSKTIGYFTIVTASVPFLLLIVLLIKFIGLPGEVEGATSGAAFYMGSETI